MKRSGLPPGEVIWVQYFTAEGRLAFVLTSKPARDTYSLYELSGDAHRLLGRARDPKTLEEKFHIVDRLMDSAK